MKHICKRCETEKEVTEFQTDKGMKRGHRNVCKACENQAKKERENHRCSSCNKLTWKNKAAQVPVCNDCRASEHKGSTYYRRGCRCETCREWQRDESKAYAEKFREKNGCLPSAMYRRGNKTTLARINWIDPESRLAIYERDEWVCQLCHDPIDREAGRNEHFAPSLDHIIPKSKGGPDTNDNLRTAHRICNAIRGAREDEAAAV